ncbi:MAG: hydrogenase maturation nickel metallochaperone HypA [Anaerolineales bacterium]|nr:hydrogenase maturation nickel metallochaperone HypA [Anaerolineales bacterium]
MHELSVTESILEITLRHAQGADARRVTDLFLVIGQLSSIIDDSVNFYWDIISKDTIAEGAQLHFRRVETQLRCNQCGLAYQPTKKELACPDCESRDITVVTGDEFFLESISVETDEQD